MDATDWDRRYAGDTLLWSAEPNRFLVAETSELPPGRALDLACGEGRNAVWLAERGFRVTGVDFSAVGIEKARGLAAERGVSCDWIVSDLLDYRPDATAYDLVILFYLQVSELDRRPILQAAATAVAPGGTFLLVAHDVSNLADGHGGPSDPAVLYTAGGVAEVLAKGGLAVERAERVDRPVETPDGERIALDVLVRAKRAA
jgi:SAM-dependent methyltransferase